METSKLEKDEQAAIIQELRDSLENKQSSIAKCDTLERELQDLREETGTQITALTASN